MKEIIKSILGTSSEEGFEVLKYALEDLTVVGTEADVCKFLVEFYAEKQKFPSEEVLLYQYPYFQIKNIDGIDLAEGNLMDLYFLLKQKQENVRNSEIILGIGSRVNKEGLSLKDIDNIMSLAGSKVSESEVTWENLHEVYAEYKTKRKGLRTGCKEIDEITKGCRVGTVTVIAGFPRHGKTLFGINIMYTNFLDNLTSIYVSIETPKDDVMFNILSRHSMHPKFAGRKPVPVSKIIHGEMTPEEYDFIMGDVRQDILDSESKMIVLDPTDFKEYDKSEFLQKIDYYTKEYGKISALFIDYIQLFQIPGRFKLRDVKEIGNTYIQFFRELAITKEISVFLLSQTNREGERTAAKNGGRYDIQGLSELNSLEREAFRIFTVWSNQMLMEAGEVKCCILKNRDGRFQEEPFSVSANPAYYSFASGESPQIEVSKDSFDDWDVSLFS